MTTTSSSSSSSSSSLQSTVESSDDSYNVFDVVLKKIFAVLGRRTSALLNLIFGCLLCVSLIAILIAICVAIYRRKQRTFNKTSFVVAGAEKTNERSNGRYSLDPMTTGKQQQQQQQQHRDDDSDNNYANYGADPDDDDYDADLYESIDDIKH